MPKIIATFFGIGYFPKGPGTAASVVSLLLWVPLARNMHGMVYGWLGYGLTWILVCVIGFWASAQFMRQDTRKDPQVIVIDEVAGMGAACFLLPPGWIWVLVALALFRVFDIWKMGPMAHADRNWSGAKGVMADDIFAGVAAWILCQAIYRLMWSV